MYNLEFRDSSVWSSSVIDINRCLFKECVSHSHSGGGFYCSKTGASLSLVSTLFFRCVALVSMVTQGRNSSGGAFIFSGSTGVMNKCCICECSGPAMSFGFLLSCTSSIVMKLSHCNQNGLSNMGSYLFLLDYGIQTIENVNSSKNTCLAHCSSGCFGHISDSANMKYSLIANCIGSYTAFYFTGDHSVGSYCNFIGNYPSMSLFCTWATSNIVQYSAFIDSTNTINYNSQTKITLKNCKSTGNFLGYVTTISCSSTLNSVPTYELISNLTCNKMMFYTHQYMFKCIYNVFVIYLLVFS